MLKCGKCGVWFVKTNEPIEFALDGKKIIYNGTSWKCPICGFYMLDEKFPSKNEEIRKSETC